MQREDAQRHRVLKQKETAKKEFRDEYRTRYLEGVASMADALGLQLSPPQTVVYMGTLYTEYTTRALTFDIFFLDRYRTRRKAPTGRCNARLRVLDPRQGHCG